MQLKAIKAFLQTLCLLGAICVSGAVWAAGNPCRDIGVAGECDLFQANIQVQPSSAQELIRLALNDKNVTFGEYTNKMVGDDTYEVTDSNGAKHIFLFDDLQDSKSQTVNRSIMNAVCLINNGTPQDNSNICYGRLSEDRLNQDLGSFAMYAECFDNMNSTPYCQFFDTAVIGELRGFVLNGKSIIDPKMFQTMQIVSTDEVKNYLRDYTMLTIGSYGLILRGFGCLNTPKKYKENENSISTDDVLVCTVSYYDPSTDQVQKQSIDFLFDDMYEHGRMAASAGRSGLICSAQGGSATSRGVCAGFTQELCSDMAAQFDVDTRWDPDAGGCIMTDSQKNARRQQVSSVAGTAALTIVGIVALPVSGGGSAVAIAAVIGGVLTLVSGVTSSVVGAVIDSRFTAALLGANKCLVNTCGGVVTKNNQMYVKNKTSASCIECATSSVQSLIEATVVYEGDFQESNANASAYLIDVLYTVIHGTLQPICVAEIATNVEQSPLVKIQEVSNAVMLVGAILSLGAGGVGKITNANMTSIMDKVLGRVKNISLGKINPVAIETLATSSRIERMANRIKNTASTTVKAIQEYKKLLGTQSLSQGATKFVGNLAQVSNMKDGNAAASSIVQSWTASCSTDFPCNTPISDFMTTGTLNNLCLGG